MPRIYIVEDDEDIRALTSYALEASGFTCEGFEEGGSLFAKLEGGGAAPDMILLDILMPGMDGYETLHRIRENTRLRDVPVIFLTGVTDSVAELRGLQAGALDYITKPFVRAVLLARIAVHLETGHQKKRLRSLEGEGEFVKIDEEKFARLALILSPTEQKVTKLIALGYNNQEICDQLGYSYSYVKKIIAAIFDKAGISKRQELRRRIT